MYVSLSKNSKDGGWIEYTFFLWKNGIDMDVGGTRTPKQKNTNKVDFQNNPALICEASNIWQNLLVLIKSLVFMNLIKSDFHISE